MPRKHDPYRKATAPGPDNGFVFRDDIKYWMPTFRATNERYKRYKEKIRLGQEKKERNTSGFRRANNAMLCSERRDVK